MDMPPTRFRVVERGRRLEVIDTATGRAITPRGVADPLAPLPTPVAKPGALPAPTRPTAAPRPTRRSGTATTLGEHMVAGSLDAPMPWTTRAFYDDKGPRLVTPHASRAVVARALPVAVVIVTLLIGTVAVTAPWLLVGLWALGNPKVRARLRQRSTALLDWLEQPA